MLSVDKGNFELMQFRDAQHFLNYSLGNISDVASACSVSSFPRADVWDCDECDCGLGL